jgi:hypothetical protein
MRLSEIWNSIPEGESGETKNREVADLKDGMYNMEVIGFRFFQSKSGDYYYCWNLVVRDGRSKGSYTEKFSGTSAISMDILKKDVRRVSGRWIPLEEIYDEDNDRLGPAVGELVGAIVEIRKRDDPKGRINQKTGKPYFNLDFMRLIRGVGQVPAHPPQEEVSDDDDLLAGSEDEEGDLLDDDDIPF